MINNPNYYCCNKTFFELHFSFFSIGLFKKLLISISFILVFFAEAQILEEEFKLLSPNPKVGGKFGRKVACDNEQAIIFSGEESTTDFARGTIHIYKVTQKNQWSHVKSLDSLPNETKDFWYLFSPTQSINIKDDFLFYGDGNVKIYKKDATGNYNFYNEFRGEFGAGPTGPIIIKSDIVWYTFYNTFPNNHHSVFHQKLLSSTAPDNFNFGVISSGTSTSTPIEDNYYFGKSLLIENNMIFIGCPPNPDKIDKAGLVYIYDVSNINLGFDNVYGMPSQKLHASDSGSAKDFGTALAIKENLLIVGAPNASAMVGNSLIDSTGALYIFKRNENTGRWEELQKINASDPEKGAKFGEKIQVIENYVIVSSHLKDQDIKADVGQVYIYEIQTDRTLIEKQILVASDAAEGSEFGSEILATSDRVFVAAESHLSSGAVYSFKLSEINTGIFSNKNLTQTLKSNISLVALNRSSLMLQMGINPSDIQIKIYQLNGKEILKINVSSLNYGKDKILPIPTLANGTYIYTLKNENLKQILKQGHLCIKN